jgi:hypothetical protein
VAGFSVRYSGRQCRICKLFSSNDPGTRYIFPIRINISGNSMEKIDKYAGKTFFKPATGSILAVASGLSFFFLCMILPLVGPAGSRVDHAGANRAVFVLVLLFTLALAGLASWSKLGRSRSEGVPLPWFSFGMCAICLLTLVVLLFNGFAL